MNGIAAYDAWIADLEDEQGIAELTPDQFLNYWQGHAVMYDQLHDARYAAMRYLQRIAAESGGKQRESLLSASGTYEQLVQHMTENWECFPFSDEEYVEPRTGWWLRVQQEEFLGHRVPAYSGEWPADTRERGTEVLKAVKEKDEQGLAVLSELA